MSISGMPAHLAEAVNQHDVHTRRLIVRKWVMIGAERRQRYRDEIDAKNLRTHQRRCRRAAKQLLEAPE